MLGGRLLLCTRESLVRRLFAKGRTSYGTIGTRSSAICMQRPTGQPGAIRNRIFRCIAIEHRIQDSGNAAIFGVDLAESSHCYDDGDSALSNIIANDTGANGSPDGDGGGGPPVADIHFNHGGNQEGSEKIKEVGSATLWM